MARTASKLRGDLPFIVVDAVLVAAVYLSLTVMRFSGSVPDEWWHRFRLFLVAAVALHFLANLGAGLYGALWRHAGVREAQRLLAAGGVTLLLVTALSSLPATRLPLSVAIVGPLLATGLIGVSRFQARLFGIRRHRNSHDDDGEDGGGLRVALLGAGETGANLAREMQVSPKLGLIPVAFFDDNPRTRGRSVRGVPVLGAIEDLAGLAERRGINKAVLAIRDANGEVMNRAVRAAESAGIPLQTIPTMGELISAQPGLRDVRDLRIDDLLGRQQVTTDTSAIRKLIEGRCVLVTGGGGSIGSEVARQACSMGAAAVVLLDHDETHLHEAALDLSSAVQVLADVRDEAQVREAFSTYKPDIVFHAAAHKHVPILESFPAEALRTNVLGTANVLAAGHSFRTERLIVISTDKAVRPVSVMGATKRVSERLLSAYAGPGIRWCAVRFGNVLASRGSVVPTFARQIQIGGPVTVTDRRMTRYFMSISEAVELVLQAATMARGGELYMLDMGEPVKIIELARRMIHLSGRREGVDVRIEEIGCRPGEKLEEQLHFPEESTEDTEHPAIHRLRPANERLDEVLLELQVLQAHARLAEPGSLRDAILAAAHRELSTDEYVLDLRGAAEELSTASEGS